MAGIGIGLGAAIGIIAGFALFHDVVGAGLGLALGAGIGVAIGAGLDAAKKNGAKPHA